MTQLDTSSQTSAELFCSRLLVLLGAQGLLFSQSGGTPGWGPVCACIFNGGLSACSIGEPLW